MKSVATPLTLAVVIGTILLTGCYAREAKNARMQAVTLEEHLASTQAAMARAVLIHRERNALLLELKDLADAEDYEQLKTKLDEACAEIPENMRGKT